MCILQFCVPGCLWFIFCLCWCRWLYILSVAVFSVGFFVLFVLGVVDKYLFFMQGMDFHRLGTISVLDYRSWYANTSHTKRIKKAMGTNTPIHHFDHKQQSTQAQQGTTRHNLQQVTTTYNNVLKWHIGVFLGPYLTALAEQDACNTNSACSWCPDQSVCVNSIPSNTTLGDFCPTFVSLSICTHWYLEPLLVAQ